MGSIDAVNLDPVVNSVTPGANTVEKYQKIHVTAMGGSSSIQNLKVWRTGALGGAATHLTSARTATYAAPAYPAAAATPSTTPNAATTQAMPTAVPATANLGIAGVLTGSLTAAGSSDFLAHIITTNAADTAGSTSTQNYQYDEVA